MKKRSVKMMEEFLNGNGRAKTKQKKEKEYETSSFSNT